MSSRGEKPMVSPRVVDGVTTKIIKRVSAELATQQQSSCGSALPALGSPRESPRAGLLSPSEQSFISTSVEHFLVQQRSANVAISESHLVDLARMLSNAVIEKRHSAARNAAEASKPASIPLRAECLQASPRCPEPPAVQKGDGKSTGLPPLRLGGGVSPRSVGAASGVTSAAPYATADSVQLFAKECAAKIETTKATRAHLSAELEHQLGEKEALKERMRNLKHQERTARLLELEHAKKLEEDVKKVKRMLVANQNDEYTHYANTRALDEQKEKLEKRLEDHLQRKRDQSSERDELEIRRRKQAETAAYLAMQSEQESARRRAAATELKSAVAQPFFIGASDEEVRRKAQQRKQSLAQGLEAQLQEHRIQQAVAA